MSLLLSVWLGVFQARAVLLLFTDDPLANTTAPTGLLQDSGWQYQGQWGSSLGTPVAATFFITAKHVGGSIGGSFLFNGVSYTTTGYSDCPSSDLRVWQVSSAFPAYAPLYTDSDEPSKSLVVFGRGTRRGSEVSVSSNLRGWQWGASDNVQRWGENVVSGSVDGGSGVGQLLMADFNYGAGSNEAHLSGGDSGGAVFIKSGGIWKLAGINYGVDAFFSLTGENGSGFNAAIFDAGGLFYGTDGNWQYITDRTADIPSSFYATRISANAAWIQAVIPEPETWASLASLLLLAFAAWRRRRSSL